MTTLLVCQQINPQQPAAASSPERAAKLTRLPIMFLRNRPSFFSSCCLMPLTPWLFSAAGAGNQTVWLGAGAGVGVGSQCTDQPQGGRWMESSNARGTPVPCPSLGNTAECPSGTSRRDSPQIHPVVPLSTHPRWCRSAHSGCSAGPARAVGCAPAAPAPSPLQWTTKLGEHGVKGSRPGDAVARQRTCVQPCPTSGGAWHTGTCVPSGQASGLACRGALATALAVHGQQVEVCIDQFDEQHVLWVLVHLQERWQRCKLGCTHRQAGDGSTTRARTQCVARTARCGCSSSCQHMQQQQHSTLAPARQQVLGSPSPPRG